MVQTNLQDSDILNQQIKNVLFETIQNLFPMSVDPNNLIKPHIWRDKKYLGEKNGRVITWRGYSANLVEIDFRYRAIFIDVVDNILPSEERVRLFGEDFANAISSLSQFVVMFVLDFPLDTLQDIKGQGFTPRRMTKALHACIVVSIDEFLATHPLYWSAKVARLVLLQRVLSIHRKPLDTNEIPLQNLLYKSGYLHSYIVKGGLELYKLSRPRKAGDFGHDLQALVNNPKLQLPQPFLLGIELYTGPMGYHINTIPQYVHQFDLRGMVVISKDDPWPNLNRVASNFYRPIFVAKKLSDIGHGESIAIHYLPLDLIISELALLRDELETLLPIIPVFN